MIADDPVLFGIAEKMPPMENTSCRSFGIWGWGRKAFHLPEGELLKLVQRWLARTDRNNGFSPWVRSDDPNGRHIYTGRKFGLETVSEVEHYRYQIIELVMKANPATLQKMLSTLREGEHEKTI